MGTGASLHFISLSGTAGGNEAYAHFGVPETAAERSPAPFWLSMISSILKTKVVSDFVASISVLITINPLHCLHAFSREAISLYDLDPTGKLRPSLTQDMDANVLWNDQRCFLAVIDMDALYIYSSMI